MACLALATDGSWFGTRPAKANDRSFPCRVSADPRPGPSGHAETPDSPCAPHRDPGSNPVSLSGQNSRAWLSHRSTWVVILPEAGPWVCSILPGEPNTVEVCRTEGGKIGIPFIFCERAPAQNGAVTNVR